MERPGEHRGLRSWAQGQWRGPLGGDSVCRLANLRACVRVTVRGWKGEPGHAPHVTGFYPRPQLCVQRGRGGDRRACYGHLLHEVQKASQTSMLLRLRVAFAMLGV